MLDLEHTACQAPSIEPKTRLEHAEGLRVARDPGDTWNFFPGAGRSAPL